MKSNWTSHILLAGISNVKTTLEDNSTFFYHVKPILTIQLNSFTSKYLSKWSENLGGHKNCSWWSTVALFLTPQTSTTQQPQCTPPGEGVTNIWWNTVDAVLGKEQGLHNRTPRRTPSAERMLSLEDVLGTKAKLWRQKQMNGSRGWRSGERLTTKRHVGISGGERCWLWWRLCDSTCLSKAERCTKI